MKTTLEKLSKQMTAVNAGTVDPYTEQDNTAAALKAQARRRHQHGHSRY